MDLQSRVHGAHVFLQECSGLLPSRTTELDVDLYDRLMGEWAEPLLSLSAADLFSFAAVMPPPHLLAQLPPTLRDFLTSCHNFSVHSVFAAGGARHAASALPQRMKGHSPQKAHETLLLAERVERVALQTNTSLIVDLGAGKCYLEQALARGTTLKVLAVDRRAHGVHHATGAHVHAVTADVVASLTRAQIQAWMPPAWPPVDGVLLAGLHACGDLGALTLRSVVSADATGVVTVPCCYNLINTQAAHGDAGLLNFPLSRAVAALRVGPDIYSWDARNLACQSAHRLAADGPASVTKLLQRRFLALQPWCPPGVHVGRIATKTPLFSEYAAGVVARVGVTPNVELPAAALLDAAFTAFRAAMFPRFVAYWAVRSCLGPVLETLFLADRVLFLEEQGYTASCEALFDPLISPRNHVLVAVKKS